MPLMVQCNGCMSLRNITAYFSRLRSDNCLIKEMMMMMTAITAKRLDFNIPQSRLDFFQLLSFRGHSIYESGFEYLVGMRLLTIV